jgi:hypothetical protein
MNVEDQLMARFAKQIDLPAYLAQRGYDFAGTVRGQDSAAGFTVGIVMRNVDREPPMLLLSRDSERGGWAYTYPTNPAGPGSAADYLVRHEKLSRSASLERLAACLNRSRRDVPEAEKYRACIADKPLPLRRAENEHEVFAQQHRDVVADLGRLGVRARTAIDMCGPRAVPAALPDRFPALKVPADVHQLVEEPAKLWTSSYKTTDKQLVLVERGIDALAHAQKHRNPDVCYVAVGSELTPVRRTQLSHLLAELPAGMAVVAAFGRDEAGRRLADDVGRLAPQLPLQRTPPEFGARWSDQMQLEGRHTRSLDRAHASGIAR